MKIACHCARERGGKQTSNKTDYKHDGHTTYCWHINEPSFNAKLSERDRTQEYSGTDGCPIAMTLSVDTTSVEVNTPTDVSWTVDADFNGKNLVNMTHLAYGQDSSGRTAQIVHSNLHSCVYQSGCDPFNDGKQLEDKTANQIANLTDNAAVFKDAVQFAYPGSYSLLAHIIMPDVNSSRQYAYAVYVELTVTKAATEDITEAPVAATKDDSGLLSQTAIIVIVICVVVVVVAVLVVAVVLWRRKGSTSSINSYCYSPPPSYDAVSDLNLLGPKDTMERSDRGTANITGSWSNLGNSHPGCISDGTNGSHGSLNFSSKDCHGNDQYEVTYCDANYRSMEKDHKRLRRVDSEVEL
ncbi:hypothetical protein PsorP6_009901 [Peronosclerospora sorghi]|uniref:Uncharacterized protein n=1 Tax=Peronosclerospora sorghi TaxID=230839 RepID=A0ACC0VYV7_9STRA|nr:hypothetical protein PsorP6_009901 [Peronosclerospora sorghi]